MTEQNKFWIPLDNAAKIFPAIRSKEQTTVIRLTAVLHERINIGSLVKAVTRAEKRFPYFKVYLRRGFFWYYLEQTHEAFSVQHDKDIPCRNFKSNRHKELLLRILVHKNRLSVEFSHILTDGYGVLTFLRTLLGYYFNEKGLLNQTQLDEFIPPEIENEEHEDGYNRHFKENIPKVIQQTKSYHLPFPLKDKPRFDLLIAILPIEQIKKKVKEKGVSITDYLVAIYLLAIQEIYFEDKTRKFSKRTIARIQVPVNLRNIYPSKTLRNFSLFVMPEIDFRLGNYSFDELLKIVHYRMRLETDEKLISKIISRNVGSERNLLVRGIPIWLKSLVLFFKYHTEGTNQYTGVVTNLGKIKLPDSIGNRVNYFVLTPPPPNKRLKINCGVIGYDDKLALSFGNITKTREFERKYIQILRKQGIDIRITQEKNNS